MHRRCYQWEMPLISMRKSGTVDDLVPALYAYILLMRSVGFHKVIYTMACKFAFSQSQNEFPLFVYPHPRFQSPVRWYVLSVQACLTPIELSQHCAWSCSLRHWTNKCILFHRKAIEPVSLATNSIGDMKTSTSKRNNQDVWMAIEYNMSEFLVHSIFWNSLAFVR